MEKTEALRTFGALAQEARLDIFRLLVGAGAEGMAAGGIGRTLGIPPATLSFHLKELKFAGVVHCRRNGRSLIYSPDFGVMNELLAYLTENCCKGVADCAQPGAPRRGESARRR